VTIHSIEVGVWIVCQHINDPSSTTPS